MLIVNTTYQVAESCETAWKEWLRSEYIPEVTRSGMLVEPRFSRLLIENETGHVSYALQFETESLDSLEQWFQTYGQELQQSMSQRFNSDVLGFTTLMEQEELG